ncbi:MAG: polysaccharide deacetylase family protein [Sediminibacterium sp.]
MLLIYTTYISNRLQYSVDTLFKQISSVPFELTADINLYQQSDATGRINYSIAKIEGDEVWIQPHSLLFEKDIHTQTIECFEWNNLKAFFKTGGDIPFDIFAASFYLITRYEEYLQHTEDEYGRYGYSNSAAFKENFLHLPLINLWQKELLKLLQQKFLSLSIPNSQFRFLPTYDIDIAYSYLHKPFLNNIGGICKELFTGKWKQLAERAGVLPGFIKDPFVNYDLLDTLHEMYNLHPVYFFLVAEKRKLYDKNISPHNKYMKQLIRWHARKYLTGIHPSWQSGDNDAILKKEFLLFEEIINKKTTTSRQHYIRMNLPVTYRLLMEYGITDDYSMGYGSINGFRASVASAFFWYDLEKDEPTQLMVHPFCYMEANSFFEQHYTPQQAAEEIQQYHDIVKSVNGKMITIFHNHFITEQQQWIDWRNMYIDFLKKNF